MATKVRLLVSKLFERAIDGGHADTNPTTRSRKPRTRKARMQAKGSDGRKLRILNDEELGRLAPSSRIAGGRWSS